MQSALENWRVWSRAIRQAATVLGLAMIVLTWTGVELYLGSEYDNAGRAAFTNLQNLARAFDAHVVRSVQEIDKTLLMLRTAYEKDPAHFEFSTWLANPAFRGDLTWQFTITDADGIVIKSSAFAITRRIDVSHFDHVRDHMDTNEDRLLISTPSIGLTSGQWSVQLTRRISRPDGSFTGVFSAAVNPDHFSRFYNSIDLGKDGSISLAGFDGVIRASVGPKASMLGNTIIGTETFQRFRREPVASHLGRGRTDGFDGSCPIASSTVIRWSSSSVPPRATCLPTTIANSGPTASLRPA